MDSYYAMLKVTRDSKFPEDVTKSYRKLALRAHPDKGGSKEAFDALHRAYEVLKDEEKRKVYDRFGFDFGDDESADELLGELSPMAMRLIGIAIFRAALCGAVVVGLRYRVPRTLCIAACGGCVVYGSTRSDRDFEFLGYRAVFVPLIAWLASYVGLTFVFDVVVYAITFGALEWENLSEGRGTRSSSRREVVVRRVALVLRQIVTWIWGFTHRAHICFLWSSHQS